MLNILICKFPYASLYGGGEKHTFDLVENLQKKNFTFYFAGSCPVLLAEFIKKNWLVRKTWGGKEPVAKWSLAVFFFIWPIIFLNLLRLLVVYKLKHKINILYCLSLTEKILLTLPARCMGIKVIWMEHKLIGNWLYLSPLKYLFILFSRLALIITVSQTAKESITKLGVAEKNIQVIYNGVDLEKFLPRPSSLDNLSKEFRVGFIGRLDAEKGVKYLILAIAKLKTVIPQIKLIIIGEGPDKKSLQMLIKDKGIADKVFFVGFQQNTAKWLANFDCLVLPSVKQESFGLVAAEALACLKPVIVTNIGGLKEVVADCGYLIEPHHSTGIADALITVYKNYHQALEKAKAGRLRVAENFSQEKMLENYAQTFQNLT